MTRQTRQTSQTTQLAILIALLFGTNHSSAADDAAVAREVRAALERSLVYVESRGREWMEGGAPGQSAACNSCHVVTFMVWSHRNAARAGVPVDQEVLDEITNWSLRDGGGTDETYQLMHALGAQWNREVLDELAEKLTGARESDGSWKAGGQLPDQKRPKAETHGATTMWALLALESIGRAEAEERARALAIVDEVTAPVSAEWLALRSAVAAEGDERSRWLTDLREAQHADGGFGWLLAEPGDALATGIVVHLLRRIGVERDDPTLARAAAFLVRTQREDGSWLVHGTKESRRNGETWTSAFWGAAWAAIGLADVLPGPIPPGWHAIGGGTWEARDGVITGRAHREDSAHGLLVTDATYGDFEATFEYRVHQGDSGFYFRVEESDDGVGVHGFQIEVDDVEPGGLYETGGRGWVIKHAPDVAARWHRKGEWNEVRLEARGTRVRVWVNDQPTADLDDPEGRRSGHIALQLHGGQDMHVEFRNIVIQ